jgi:hypothetical protein
MRNILAGQNSTFHSSGHFCLKPHRGDSSVATAATCTPSFRIDLALTDVQFMHARRHSASISR